MVVSRPRIYASGYGNLTLQGDELQMLRSLHVLGVTFDSKLMFETHSHEVVSQAARSLGAVRRAGKLFDCPRALKNCFNTYALSSLEYCASVWISSAESHLSLLARVVRRAARFYESKIYCLGTEGGSILCVRSIIITTEQTTLCMSIYIILLELVILELQLLWVSQHS